MGGSPVSYLLGTNVVSEWSKTAPNQGVVDFYSRSHSEDMFLSVVSVGELWRGVTLLRRRNDHRQADRIETWLTSTTGGFADRLAPVTIEIAEEWGRSAEHLGIPAADGLIAATAKVHGWTLVTRNSKDLEHTGVRVLNPFVD